MITFVSILLIFSLIGTYYFKQKLFAEETDRQMSYILRRGRKHD